ncbi:hypothetical protein V9K92_22665, partial [Phyllobacterium sp. CCNWLW109]|uniref:hypothetical protein n=1 Tax=Phyllobacterium sp. CCNWLW109 TaxID=3127479 RepID=UPI003076FFD0
ARQAHNLKVTGSNPVPATNNSTSPKAQPNKPSSKQPAVIQLYKLPSCDTSPVTPKDLHKRTVDILILDYDPCGSQP